jgi:sensor domain CHASE-containing protein
MTLSVILNNSFSNHCYPIALGNVCFVVVSVHTSTIVRHVKEIAMKGPVAADRLGMVRGS